MTTIMRQRLRWPLLLKQSRLHKVFPKESPVNSHLSPQRAIEELQIAGRQATACLHLSRTPAGEVQNAFSLAVKAIGETSHGVAVVAVKVPWIQSDLTSLRKPGNIKTHVNRQEKPAGYFAIFAAKIPDPQLTEIHTK